MKKNNSEGNTLAIGAIILAVVLLVGIFYWKSSAPKMAAPIFSGSDLPLPAAAATSTASTTVALNVKSLRPRYVTVAQGLKIPWDIAFLPDGSELVTLRIGQLLYFKSDGATTTIKLPHAVPKGEGGLLGIALHPRFAENHELYLYMSTSLSGSTTKNAVFRYVFDGKKLLSEKVIIKDIPGALYHDGGRLEFGPDGMLYITTGDATIDRIAQDKKSLGGKILRLTDDGKIPSDNPFGTAVYSYGHRNPQGLAWDADGRLWETEHGRSGKVTGMDEINVIEKGKNYGWPNIEGGKTLEGMVTPVLNSGPDITWAPASTLYYGGSLFFGGLKGETLYEAVLEGGKVKELKSHFAHEFGRIRTVRLGPDGMIYLLTSNTDGRGTTTPQDDRIVLVNPAALK